VLGGVAVAATRELHETIWHQSVELGTSADPFASWLAVRGLATLPLRIARHTSNAHYLASKLAEHPLVERVLYPSLPDHPQYELARRILPNGTGGVLSFELRGGREAGRTFTEATALASLTGSLGSARTLVLHPASTSHRAMSADDLAAAGFGEGTVRVAVGIEHPDDLWADMEQALAKSA
jgi:methionine-gamma-lyase